MKAGGLGFSGSNPVIQVAGAQKIIDTAPELLLASGNYTVVPALFGANKQEGSLVLGGRRSIKNKKSINIDYSLKRSLNMFAS